MTTVRNSEEGALIKRELFATDFSAASLQALPYARRIARQFHSKLYIVHIVPPEDYTPGATSIDEAAEVACRQARRKLKALVESEVLKGTGAETFVGHGDIWVGVSDFIDKSKIDLMVMATNGRSGIKKFLLGSVAEEAMRASPCPVLTVGPEIQISDREDFRQILCASDFSEESLTAMRHAISWSHQFNSRLTVVHALDGLPESPYLDAQMARVRLAEPARQFSARSDCEFVVTMGSPADVILEATDNAGSGLIVIGARGAGFVPRIASHFGSVAHKVVCRAPCPVLTVRPGTGGEHAS
jgi:nucleotide-binding universal stress UspA family protein